MYFTRETAKTVFNFEREANIALLPRGPQKKAPRRPDVFCGRCCTTRRVRVYTTNNATIPVVCCNPQHRNNNHTIRVHRATPCMGLAVRMRNLISGAITQRTQALFNQPLRLLPPVSPTRQSKALSPRQPRTFISSRIRCPGQTCVCGNQLDSSCIRFRSPRP